MLQPTFLYYGVCFNVYVCVDHFIRFTGRRSTDWDLFVGWEFVGDELKTLGLALSSLRATTRRENRDVGDDRVCDFLRVDADELLE